MIRSLMLLTYTAVAVLPGRRSVTPFASKNVRSARGATWLRERVLRLHGGVIIKLGDYHPPEGVRFVHTGQKICMKHDMIRNYKFLTRDMETGLWVCKPNTDCTKKEEMGYCARHGKMRRIRHLKLGRYGLICLENDCTLIPSGQCSKCGTETTQKLRGSFRFFVHPRLSRWIPPFTKHKQNKIFLCARCIPEYENLVLTMVANNTKLYKEWLKTQLESRYYKLNQSEPWRQVLIDSLEQGYPKKEIIGFEWNEGPVVEDWISVLARQCHDLGLGTPEIKLKAIDVERSRKLSDSALRFPVAYKFQILINGTTVAKGRRGWRDYAYRPFGGSYLRSKLRRQAARLNRSIHRLPRDEILGITASKHNFRMYAMQVIARRAVMDNIEKHITKQKLCKHARVMLDCMVPGPEFERMSVQNRFKGLRLQPDINLVCKKYYEEIYETMGQWLEERRYYDDDIS